ncbi:MAG: carboxypeptidase-like regulatory domain-containing protein [Bacteroidales bacterium]|nr:carboxypeptidase-like regulatory domain-containing protein [Bacteroidales bacterium]
MSQPIITTDISQIRPVFADGAGENIKRYTQLKQMFRTGKEYAVLAEPMLDGANKITWHTEFEGTPAPFSKLTEEEREAAKGRIKYQVNKLYKEAFKQLYRSDMSDVKDIFGVIDSCIEIPDYDNIYRIQMPDGKSNYVLIKWGFISDDFNAQTELVKKLVPTKVDTVRIKVIKNSKTAANEPITVIYKGKSNTLTTDGKGYVIMEDIPLGDKFSAYAEDKESTTDYTCDGSDEYHLLIGTRSADMNFVISDASGQPIADAEVSFTYDGKTYFETTDSQGRIRLRDIAEGTEVKCQQRNSEKTFICDVNQREYQMEGSRPVAEIDVTVMNEYGEGVPGIDVKFTYSEKSMSVSTDRNGKVSIDNMPPDTEFEIECSGNKYQTVVTKLTTHEGLNMTEIKIKKISTKGCMTIKVVDESGMPIANTLVRCESDDLKQEFYTNESGEIAIEQVSYNSNVVCTQIINGLGSHRHTFTFVPQQNNYVLKGMKILADVTDLRIHVTNKKKDVVPNLRITIDDGHNVINRITDRDGNINVQGLERGRSYNISTEYDGKSTELNYIPKQPQETLNLQVGRNNIGFLLWLIPLIGLLVWLIIAFLIPKITEMMNSPIIVEDTASKPKVDTTTIIAPPTIAEPEPEPIKGILLTIKDDKTGKPVPGAKIKLEYGKPAKKLEATSDSTGKFNFVDVPMEDSTLMVKVIVNAPGHEEYTASFLYTPEKVIEISETSFDSNDIPVNCGTTIDSKGYHSTIRTINVKVPKGKATIGFDMFHIPDELIVYKGRASQISEDKIIYRTDGFIKGPFRRVTFDYDSPDGLITVRINGGDNSKTQWYFKVYCPTAPAKSSATKNTTK